jgi:hypothetical protein
MNEEPTQESDAQRGKREIREFIITVIALIALLALCTFGPLWLGRHLGPGVGAIASVVALLTWVYFGPRPMPGFLPGIICLNGIAVIVSIGISQIIRFIRTE